VVDRRTIYLMVQRRRHQNSHFERKKMKNKKQRGYSTLEVG